MIDEEGFRANVAIVLVNQTGQVFWGRRIGMSAWQFPQGGIKEHETPERAMFRELHEEVGLREDDVRIIDCTDEWLRYRLPKRFVRRHQQPLCIGQKQIWFVLELVCDEAQVDLETGAEPEFEDWRWIDYWDAVENVVAFKRDVYRQALGQFAPVISSALSVDIPQRPN